MRGFTTTRQVETRSTLDALAPAPPPAQSPVPHDYLRPAGPGYDIRLAPTPMSRLLAGFGVVEAGTTGMIKGRLKLEGDGETIHESLAAANGPSR